MSFARKVLVVEDEPLLRSLIAANLSADGFEVVAVGSAAEARTVVDDFDPDLSLIHISEPTRRS